MEQLGDYRLLEELAIGTTGRVYAASRWPALGGHNLLAVKTVDSELSRNDRFVLLLRDGAARRAQFEHPNAVSLLDVTTVGDQLLLVSELVDGQSLDRVLRLWTEHQSDIDPLLSLWITERIASTLAAAHDANLAHGHLAPDQIMLTYEGEVRLLGLGRGDARGGLPLNERRRPFLAPEVLRTGVATFASDVHGLARVMHHTLAGVHSVLATPGINAPAWLPPLRSYGVVIHPALETMVEGMLGASPKARPPLDEVEAALKAAVGTRGPGLRTKLARLMQTAFTTQLAAATLRRKRITRGPDDASAQDDYFVPRLARRSITDHGDDTLPPIQQNADFVGFEPAFDTSAPRRSVGTAYGWTAESSIDELSPTDIYNSVMRHTAAADAIKKAEAGRSDPVSAGDPRLQALESGDDEDLMALVDAIVSHSTPPGGVEVGQADSDDLLDAPLLLDDEEDTVPVVPNAKSIVGVQQQTFPSVRDSLTPSVSNAPRTVSDPVVGGRRSAARRIEEELLADTGGMVYPVEDYGLLPPSTVPDAVNPSPAFTVGDRDHHPVGPVQSVEIDVGEDGTVYGSEHVDGLPLPEPLPPEAIFTDDVPRLPAGTIIGERYKIEDVIGEGGVSVVYRCAHSFLRKDVAIKVLRPELATMPPVVERFHREARSVAQLDHPNIVRVIDFGKSSTGSLFLVMDLIDGVSLADEIEREGYLAPTSAVRIAISILTGLEHAHSRGVIHRDLKPDNIMLIVAESGPTEVKILDFGIAKLGDVEIGSRPITEAGMVFGTPRYMSPEQAAGEPVDHRSDLFAVGIILYQLLSGQLPFDGETTVQILRRVLTQPAPRLRVNSLPSATAEALAERRGRSRSPRTPRNGTRRPERCEKRSKLAFRFELTPDSVSGGTMHSTFLHTGQLFTMTPK